MANICVFCSSQESIPEKYKEVAFRLGELIGQSGHNLVYGGSNLSTMGKVARGAQSKGAKAIGIVPQIFSHIKSGEDEVVMAENLAHRKALMEIKSDAFIVLAGGYGTLDEVSDIIANRVIGVHNKPIVFLNTNNFYDNLLRFYENAESEGFLKQRPNPKEEGIVYKSFSTPEEVIDYLNQVLSQN